MVHTLVTIVHVFTCILLVCVVLIQSGKGAEISASFAGSSQTVFGSSGGANFFTRFTQGAAAVFMVTWIARTLLGGQQKKSLFETPGAIPPAQSAPAAPGAGAPQAAPGAATTNAPTAAKPAAPADSAKK